MQLDSANRRLRLGHVEYRGVNGKSMDIQRNEKMQLNTLLVGHTKTLWHHGN